MCAYMHIENLYRNQDVLLFKRCYVLEKVHGTSAHVTFKRSDNPAWEGCQLTFFSGGEKHENFVRIFDEKELRRIYNEQFAGVEELTAYGEAYRGSCQGMKAAYGDKLRFIGFDVKIDGSFISVPQMDRALVSLGVEVVPWKEVSTDLAVLDAERDATSEVAVRRGCGPAVREGIVIRPPIEVTKNDGKRIIAKHKTERFSERATPQKIVTPEKLVVLSDARAIADEWVTEMRLTHVLQRLPRDANVEATRDVIFMMIEDVTREAHGEIIDTQEVRQAIAKRAAKLFQQRLRARIDAAAVITSNKSGSST